MWMLTEVDAAQASHGPGQEMMSDPKQVGRRVRYVDAIREGEDLLPPEIRREMANRTRWGSLLAPASYNPLPSQEPQSLIRFPDW